MGPIAIWFRTQTMYFYNDNTSANFWLRLWCYSPLKPCIFTTTIQVPTFDYDYDAIVQPKPCIFTATIQVPTCWHLAHRKNFWSNSNFKKLEDLHTYIYIYILKCPNGVKDYKPVLSVTQKKSNFERCPATCPPIWMVYYVLFVVTSPLQ